MKPLAAYVEQPLTPMPCAGCGQTPCYLGETRLYVCALCKKWTPWCIGGHSNEDTELENTSCDACWCKLKGVTP